MSTPFDPDAYQVGKLTPLLQKDLDLVNAIEQRLAVTNSPLDAERLQQDLTHVQTQYDRHRAEFDTLQTRLGARTVSGVQQANALTEEINDKLTLLLAIVQDAHHAVLSRFDESEQTIIHDVVSRLSAEHLAQTQILLAAIERASLPATEQQQTLAELTAALTAIQKQIPAADTQAAEQAQQALRVLEDAKIGFKHKLTVSIPFIPGILKYDREMSLDSNVNLTNAWENLKRRLGFQPKSGSA